MAGVMSDHPYCVIYNNNAVGKKCVELNRFELDADYHHLIRHIIDHLKDNRYEVNINTNLDNLKMWDRRQSFEISFKLSRKTGLFRNKAEYGDTHILWIGYTGDRPIMKNVSFKIDGRLYAPNPALQEIYKIVRNRK
ncbi:MAG: hypothetical protein JW705_07715, partial [Methanosarcinaceae archaeon]|nr:hypothetical protein [Methanosarcinaceae archaeon]